MTMDDFLFYHLISECICTLQSLEYDNLEYAHIIHYLIRLERKKMGNTYKQKVVVVGAGPVGALAALYAARRGDDVEVYELRNGM